MCYKLIYMVCHVIWAHMLIPIHSHSLLTINTWIETTMALFTELQFVTPVKKTLNLNPFYVCMYTIAYLFSYLYSRFNFMSKYALFNHIYSSNKRNQIGQWIHVNRNFFQANPCPCVGKTFCVHYQLCMASKTMQLDLFLLVSA